MCRGWASSTTFMQFSQYSSSSQMACSLMLVTATTPSMVDLSVVASTLACRDLVANSGVPAPQLEQVE